MKSFLILHQDLMISLLGYVAAALGGALAVSGSRKQSVAPSQSVQTAQRSAVGASANVPEKVSIPSEVKLSPPVVEPLTPNDRRNRQDTLTLARDLLAKGASHDRIKRILPVSDGELILLERSPFRAKNIERGSL